jgi:hypothetical protein
MFDSDESQRLIGRVAWIMAWVGAVVGQLHALSRFNTDEGREDLELPLTRAWAEPAGEALSPLLDWAHPNVVYVTYGKIWLPVFAAFTLCAFVVRRRRDPHGFEKWAWRLALTAYVGATIAVALDYWTQWSSQFNLLFAAGWFFTVPSFLLTLVGSTLLGIALLLRRSLPRTPSVLLALMIPISLAVVQVTSMGSAALPVMFAFGILGREIARAPRPDLLASGRRATTG